MVEPTSPSRHRRRYPLVFSSKCLHEILHPELKAQTSDGSSSTDTLHRRAPAGFEFSSECMNKIMGVDYHSTQYNNIPGIALSPQSVFKTGEDPPSLHSRSSVSFVSNKECIETPWMPHLSPSSLPPTRPPLFPRMTTIEPWMLEWARAKGPKTVPNGPTKPEARRY